jgi:hypothetical protein
MAVRMGLGCQNTPEVRDIPDALNKLDVSEKIVIHPALRGEMRLSVSLLLARNAYVLSLVLMVLNSDLGIYSICVQCYGARITKP